MDHIELTHFKQQGCHQRRERQLMRNWLRQRLEANDVPGKFCKLGLTQKNNYVGGGPELRKIELKFFKFSTP